jgi:hypothetical protein
LPPISWAIHATGGKPATTTFSGRGSFSPEHPARKSTAAVKKANKFILIFCKNSVKTKQHNTTLVNIPSNAHHFK